MINIFLSSLMIMFSISMFSISYRINGLNRTVVNAPMSIFEYAVPTTLDKDGGKLYFNQQELKNKYEEYLESSVYKYVTSYEVSYRFYDTENNATCVSNCGGVEIAISAPILITYKFNRTMYYEIYEV